MEAVQVQLREVGIDIELEEADWVAKIRPTLRDRKANGYLWAHSALEKGGRGAARGV